MMWKCYLRGACEATKWDGENYESMYESFVYNGKSCKWSDLWNGWKEPQSDGLNIGSEKIGSEEFAKEVRVQTAEEDHLGDGGTE